MLPIATKNGAEPTVLCCHLQVYMTHSKKATFFRVKTAKKKAQELLWAF